MKRLKIATSDGRIEEWRKRTDELDFGSRAGYINMPEQGMIRRHMMIGTLVFFAFVFCHACHQNQPALSTQKRFSSGTLEALFSLGEAGYKNGSYKNALKIFQICLDFSRKRENRRLEVDCLNKIGLIQWNEGRMDDCYSSLEQALALARRFRLEQRIADGLDFLEIFKTYTEGKELRSRGRHEESLRSFSHAVELSREKENLEFELKCCRQLSLTYWALFRLHEFYDSSLRALDMARQLHHRREEAKGLINIGLYHQKIEDYSEALIHYKQALDIAREIGDREDEAASLNNIGILYRRIGDYDRSLLHLKQALALDVDLENKIFVSQDLNNIGTTIRLTSLSTGHPELLAGSLSFYRQSLELARNARDTKTEIEVLNNMGVVLSALEDFDNSLRCFDSALRLTEEFPYLEARCMVLNNMAGLYLKRDELRESEKRFKEAIEKGLLCGRGYILWEAFYGLGQCYEKQAQVGLAQECYTSALTYVDQIRSRISLDAFKAGFARDKNKIYESLIHLLYTSSQNPGPLSLAGEIFQIVERAKARAFLESLGESRVDVLKNLSPDLGKRERELTSFISRCVRELSESGLSPNHRQLLQHQIHQAEEDYLVLLTRIREENPAEFSLLESEPIRLESVQSDLLDDRTAIVEYFLGEKASYGLVIHKSGAEVFPLPSRQEIADELRAYLKLLSEPYARRFPGHSAARRIYDAFFAPADDHLPPGIENLIVVPDGILYYLPFETLISPGGGDLEKDQYLLERFAIAYAPSCSSLFFLQKKEKRDSKPPSLLAVASPASGKNPPGAFGPLHPVSVTEELYLNRGFKMDSLPFSGREARRIARLFERNHRSVLVGEEASEAALKNLPLQDYTVIHFACHGFLDESSAFRSALVLSQESDSKEDGFLQVREIYNLRVSAEIVVLSACQTAKGRLEEVEGILGLPRIFFYSGAKTVLTSLWRIQDRTTARFMRSFYEKLFDGHPKAQALRLAKLDMIRSRFAHPHYWAAFVLSGDYSTAFPSER